jgi:Zn-dependent M28 family amino/carboxypeptidase
MKKAIVILFIGSCALAHAQQVNKQIKEKDIARIIKTLSADDMMGRSAREPKQIEKATAFIEAEFKKIGLTPLKGLNGFRQEFIKEQVSPLTVDVTIDGERIANENLILVSEKEAINMDKGLSIITIEIDPTATNKDQYFFTKAFGFARDTTSSLILVAPEFEANFKEFKGYFGKRFLNNRKSTKVFVLGKSQASTFSIKATQKIETIKMTNAVGMLEGKIKADEMVVYSAHYDHIGIEQAVEGDSIANGADDDASGTTAVISLAKYFKKQKNNNRTLIFAAFTAEEIGGFGSQYFSKQLNPDKVIAMFNIEMIGKPSKWGINNAFITGFERSDFGPILQKNLTGTPFQFQPDPYPEQNLFYRSDNATLARLGVPAHSISTDEIDIDKFYHTVNDEVETLNMANITATIRAIAICSKSIISGDDTPTRIDKTSVR